MIYLDNAATTKVRDEVFEIMLPYLRDEYGNPSGVYLAARSAHAGLDRARERMAKALNAKFAREIFFTSCGTESDNWALISSTKKGDHIITSMVEHHAVLETCAYLEKNGREVTYIKPDKYGMVHAEAVAEAIKENTALISVMHANNEVGTINPIKQIAKTAHENGILFHTDAVQSAGHIPIDVTDLDVDMLSVSGHKFHAPKGVGALYIKNTVKLHPYLNGGSQERGLRAGTENLASIVGMGLALELAVKEMETTNAYLTKLRDHMICQLMEAVPGTILNGHPTMRLPGNVNVSFKNTKAETVLFGLDLKGIAAASGSACTAGAISVSHVIKAMDIPGEYSSGATRFSFSKYTTKDDVDAAVIAVKEIFDRKI
ncbi:MAG: aminotransferase class V-fold PLP-dependent enzyme [Christensenellaceae bacterium]|nr:aminotransferase class V-fold PLP-dependent enzyme [Christensenellaceae bacterium]